MSTLTCILTLIQLYLLEACRIFDRLRYFHCVLILYCCINVYLLSIQLSSLTLSINFVIILLTLYLSLGKHFCRRKLTRRRYICLVPWSVYHCKLYEVALLTLSSLLSSLQLSILTQWMRKGKIRIWFNQEIMPLNAHYHPRPQKMTLKLEIHSSRMLTTKRSGTRCCKPGVKWLSSRWFYIKIYINAYNYHVYIYSHI